MSRSSPMPKPDPSPEPSPPQRSAQDTPTPEPDPPAELNFSITAAASSSAAAAAAAPSSSAPKPLLVAPQRTSLFNIVDHHLSLLRQHSRLINDLNRANLLRNGTSSHPELDAELFAMAERARKICDEGRNARGRIYNFVMQVGRTNVEKAKERPVGVAAQNLVKTERAAPPLVEGRQTEKEKLERARMRKNWSFKAAGTGRDCSGDAMLPGLSQRKIVFEDDAQDEDGEYQGEDGEEVEEGDGDEVAESVISGMIPKIINNTKIVFDDDVETLDRPEKEAHDKTSGADEPGQETQRHSSNEQGPSQPPQQPKVEEDDITAEVEARLQRKRAARADRLRAEEAKENGTAKGEKRKRARTSSGADPTKKKPRTDGEDEAPAADHDKRANGNLGGEGRAHETEDALLDRIRARMQANRLRFGSLAADPDANPRRKRKVRARPCVPGEATTAPATPGTTANANAYRQASNSGRPQLPHTEDGAGASAPPAQKGKRRFAQVHRADATVPTTTPEDSDGPKRRKSRHVYVLAREGRGAAGVSASVNGVEADGAALPERAGRAGKRTLREVTGNENAGSAGSSTVDEEREGAKRRRTAR